MEMHVSQGHLSLSHLVATCRMCVLMEHPAPYCSNCAITLSQREMGWDAEKQQISVWVYAECVAMKSNSCVSPSRSDVSCEVIKTSKSIQIYLTFHPCWKTKQIVESYWTVMVLTLSWAALSVRVCCENPCWLYYSFSQHLPSCYFWSRVGKNWSAW